MPIGTRMQSIEWCHLQSPWVIPNVDFRVTELLTIRWVRPPQPAACSSRSNSNSNSNSSSTPSHQKTLSSDIFLIYDSSSGGFIPQKHTPQTLLNMLDYPHLSPSTLKILVKITEKSTVVRTSFNTKDIGENNWEVNGCPYLLQH